MKVTETTAPTISPETEEEEESLTTAAGLRERVCERLPTVPITVEVTKLSARIEFDRMVRREVESGGGVGMFGGVRVEMR